MLLGAKAGSPRLAQDHGDQPGAREGQDRFSYRLVLTLKATLAPFAAFANLTVSGILRERPERLTGSVSDPEITTQSVFRFQEELTALQIALDDSQLQRITIGDLMGI